VSVYFPRFVIAALVLSLAGCSSTIRWPNLFHPGNMAKQRTNAVYTDPYPLPDVGPPIVGGRPLGYQAPVPEVTRGRLFAGPPPQVRQPAPPMIPPGY
jgi:hypothetical protein